MKIKRGSTSVRRLIFIADSSSTTGAGLTGVAYNTSGLVAYYFAGDLSNEVQITLASATLGTFTSGGFVEVDATNMPGWYEVGIPNAALDGGNEVAIQYRGAADMVPVNIYIELDTVDYQTDAFGAALASNYTGTRAGYLDKLNVSGTLAHSDAANTYKADVSGLASQASVDVIDGIVDAILVDTGTTMPTDIGTKHSVLLNEFALTRDDTDATLQVVSSVTYGNSALKTLLDAIKAKTDNLPTDPADASDISSSFSSISSTLSAISGYIDTEVAAIKAKTDNLPTDPATETTLAVLDGLVDAIKVVTDKLNTSLESDGASGYQFTTLALENAPSSGGGGGSGAGAFTVEFTIKDSDSTVLEGCDVIITSSSSAPSEDIVASAISNVNGLVTFYLDEGNYYLWRQKYGYNFSNPVSFSVSSSGVVSL